MKIVKDQSSLVFIKAAGSSVSIDDKVDNAVGVGSICSVRDHLEATVLLWMEKEGRAEV